MAVELVALTTIGVLVRIEKAAFNAVHLVAQLMAFIHEARIGIDLPPIEPLKPIADCLAALGCTRFERAKLDGCPGRTRVHGRTILGKVMRSISHHRSSMMN
jgi:hypothetical protein